MRNFLLVLLVTIIIPLHSCKELVGNNQNQNNQESLLGKRIDNWQLIWEDDFKTEGLPNKDNWDYDIADGCPKVCGWGNNELQYYTKNDLRNARVENGNLIIEAHKSEMGTKDFTSARLVTRGKHSWQNGKIEIRAKLPTGRGTWPAIWMMPEDNSYGGWPKSGEIDIMEHVGYNPDTVFGTVHTEAFNHGIGTQVDEGVYSPTTESQFHSYSIVWTDESISWYIDGNQYHEFHNMKKSYQEWPFDKPFHLILNIAVGGNWGGKKGVDPSIFPQQMVIDYVRVYKDKSI